MVQFESRATIGLVAPDSRPAIPGPIYGTGVHYVGGNRLGLFRAHHTKCREKQRDIQHFHMETKEWADFAYTFSVCPHDIVLAGRGAGVRTAANGTQWGNDHWYAGLFLIGGDEEPTDGMLRAFTEAVNGLKASSLRPHSAFKSTACPGDPTRGKIVNGAFNIPIIPEEEDMQVDSLTEGALDQIRDHIFGATYVTDESGERIRHNLVLSRLYKRTSLLVSRSADLSVEVNESELAEALMSELEPFGETIAQRVLELAAQKLAQKVQ